MIPGLAVYHAVEAMAPMYTAAVLGYASVRWLGTFSDEQCAGTNHFVALYAVPVLIFHTVSTNDPYSMSGRLVAADTLQKAVVLLALAAWAFWAHIRGGGRGKLRWVVTNFSVASLPNTSVIGVPLLGGMYGSVSGRLMKQIIVMQFCVWYNVVIFLYEFMVARDGSAKIGTVSSSAAENRDRSVGENGESIRASAKRNHDQVVEITEVAAAASPTATPTAAEETIAPAVTVTEELSADEDGAAGEAPAQQVPSVMHVVRMAGNKVLRLPNTYASFLGLIWSLIAFKFGAKMPKIVDDSLFTIYTTTVGLSMFASGTFIARQPQCVACGYATASLSMVLKFLVGPVVMLLASLAVGLHGTVLHIAVVQAALPLAVTSFVYAAEYKVHVDIMSTGFVPSITIYRQRLFF